MSYVYNYNGVKYTFSPFVQSIVGPDEDGQPIFGDTYQVVLGMSDEEAQQCHAEGQLNQLRSIRDKLLAETDWVAGTDVPQSLKDKWNPYRQALRDITEEYSSVDNVVWPEKPE